MSEQPPGTRCACGGSLVFYNGVLDCSRCGTFPTGQPAPPREAVPAITPNAAACLVTEIPGSSLNVIWCVRCCALVSKTDPCEHHAPARAAFIAQVRTLVQKWLERADVIPHPTPEMPSTERILRNCANELAALADAIEGERS